jgi:hypothetical protein
MLIKHADAKNVLASRCVPTVFDSVVDGFVTNSLLVYDIAIG